MPNLNYRGTQDGTQDFDTLIMNMIEENNKISAKIMAEKLGVSLRTVRRLIKENDQILSKKGKKRGSYKKKNQK